MPAALTQARLREVLDYDYESGAFRRSVATSNRVKVGDVAGTINSKGYRCIMVDGRLYQAHRLAFLWMTGEFPPDQVDHINGDRSDNRWSNLRRATGAENVQNIGRAPSNSRSGLVGACWHKGSKRWHATIKTNGRRRFLGVFSTAAEAHAAYLAAKRELHPFSARLGAAT